MAARSKSLEFEPTGRAFDQPGDPMQIVRSGDLSTKVKGEILQQWELETRESAGRNHGARAGNMPAIHERVRQALRHLGVAPANLPKLDDKVR